MKRKKALLVVDMLNDFLAPGGVLYCGDRARRVIPFVARKIEEFHRKGDPVIFVCDAHRRGDWELRIYPPHAMKGTRGARLVEGIPRDRRDFWIEKRFYSGFVQPRLRALLRKLKVKEVYVTGVCTSICVMENVAQIFYMKIPVHLYQRGVADFDPALHGFALKRMKKIFGVHLIP